MSVPFKSIEQYIIFTEKYFEHNNIQMAKGVITKESLNTFIPIFREEKKNSPKKADPALTVELYSKWCENTTLDIREKIKKYTGDKIALALADVGINAEELVGTTKFSKHKDELTDALIKAYNEKRGQVSSKDETNENQNEVSEDKNQNEVSEDENQNEVSEDEYLSEEEDNNEEDDIMTHKNELIAQYDSMTVKELKALCKERSIEIDKSAKKPDLIVLLVEYELNA
jgi:hypothetical protein